MAAGLVEEAAGTLVVAATDYTDIVGADVIRLIRLDHDGHGATELDAAMGYATGLARRSDGQLVVSGGVTGDMFQSRAAVQRWRKNGTHDESFGDHGVDLAAELASAGPAIAVDARDRILLAGDILSRHAPGGTLDPTFGLDGVTSGIVAHGGGAEYTAVAVQPDGKIVVVGIECPTTDATNGGCAAVIERYESDRTQFCGDADADGRTTVTDGVATLRAAAGLDGVCTAAICDVDGDGTITLTDGVDVLRAAAGLPASLRCGLP